MRTKTSLVALILVLIGVVFSAIPIVVSAESNPVITITNPPSKDKREFDKMCTDINESLHNNKLFMIDGLWTENFLTYDNNENITINMLTYKDYGQEDRQKIMQIALSGIHNSGVSRSNRNKIYNELCSLDETTSALVRQLSEDVQADFAGAYTSFKPFTGFFGWLLGIITLGLFLTLGLSIVFDIAYINLPFMQLALSRQEGEKPKLVSLEAWSAVKEADSKAGESYVSPNTIFLKHKSKQYVVVAICILYLTSGQIFNLIANAVDYFRGILR